MQCSVSGKAMYIPELNFLFNKKYIYIYWNFAFIFNLLLIEVCQSGSFVAYKAARGYK
jgi:hypothetical protein